MRLKIDPIRALQAGFLLLLAICAGQVVYWIFEEVHHTDDLHAQIERLRQEEVDGARRLLEQGMKPEDVADVFPGIIFSSGPERVALDPAHIEELRRERYHRLRRIGWEGTFFIVVLVAAMAVLAQALHQDAQLRRRQQNFLAAVTHEFKSPLAALQLSAETLLLRDPPLDGRRKLLRRILDDTGRLEAMVTNLLDTARLEEGRVHLQPERLALSPAVQAVVEELAARAAELGVQLRPAVEPDLEIHADPLAVRTVLRNLLDNALKATVAAGGGAVTLRARADGAYVRVEIEDSGVGFAPHEAQRLFGKFYRPGDEMRRESRGSGLGLYIVRRFVELERGKVSAHSDGPGKGAVFTVLWPVAGRS